MQILKKAHCGGVSNPTKQTLTYNVGHRDDEYHLRITDNEGGGFFSDEWVSLAAISSLTSKEETFSTSLLAPLYESKSSNNQGFLAALLVQEKIWLPVIGNRRLFSIGDLATFTDSMQQLIKKKISLKDEVAERKAKKEAARLSLEKKLKAKRAKSASQSKAKSRSNP